MNLDVLKENPPWPWYFVIAGPIIILVLAVWLVFKYNQVCSYNSIQSQIYADK